MPVRKKAAAQQQQSEHEESDDSEHSSVLVGVRGRQNAKKAKEKKDKEKEKQKEEHSSESEEEKDRWGTKPLGILYDELNGMVLRNIEGSKVLGIWSKPLLRAVRQGSEFFLAPWMGQLKARYVQIVQGEETRELANDVLDGGRELGCIGPLTGKCAACPMLYAPILNELAALVFVAEQGEYGMEPLRLVLNVLLRKRAALKRQTLEKMSTTPSPSRISAILGHNTELTPGAVKVTPPQVPVVLQQAPVTAQQAPVISHQAAPVTSRGRGGGGNFVSGGRGGRGGSQMCRQTIAGIKYVPVWQAKDNECRKCGVVGHFSSDCSTGQIKCQACGLMGHMANGCPSPSHVVP